MDQVVLIKAMYLVYQSLTVVILVNISGLMLVVVVKWIAVLTIALAALSLIVRSLLLLLLAITITVNQLLGIVLTTHIISMTLYGMEQDV